MNLDAFNTSSALVCGIGNVGRQDDGLGWAFVDWLEAMALCPRAEVTRHYQLQLEDADLISRKSRVLFVDATKDPSVTSFSVLQPKPSLDFSFTSHAMSVSSVLATCQQCFEQVPEVHVLGIRGYEWELQIGLTPGAERNLQNVTNQLLNERT